MSTYTVTGTGDAAGSITPTGPGAFTATTLRAALTAANARRGADTIRFGQAVAGTIGLSRALPQVTDALTITGPGASRLALTRLPGAVGNFSVLSVGAGVTAAISGLTVTGGKGTARPAPAERAGGGIFNAGKLTVRNVTIRGNTAEVGGGVFNAKGGVLTLRDSTLSGNAASNLGGAFLNDSGAIAAVINCTLSGGLALGGGGGIANQGELTVRDSRVRGNSTGPIDPDNFAVGGGILNALGARLSFVRSTLSGNSASAGGGLANGATAVIRDSTISGNRADEAAGVVSLIGSLDVRGSTFSGNSATVDAGGLETLGGTIVVVNTTFAGNSAAPSAEGGGGGGIEVGNPDPSDSATLINVTVADNRGGGIQILAGTLNLFNTIVARNAAGPASSSAPQDILVLPDEDGLHGEIGNASAFNLIGTGGSGGLKNGVKGNLVGVADPKLGPLDNNGGPTGTIALLPGSRAINAGSNALAVGPDRKPLTTDQRGDGFARVVGGRVDIGAFELRG